MDIFYLISGLFNVINNLLQTIIDGISIVSNFLYSTFDFMFKIAYILPTQIFLCFMAFVGVWSFIIIYKLCRKG